MKLFFVFALILLTTVAKAQLAVINDPDGFVNVRDGKSSNSKIVGKLYNNEAFLFDGESENDQWINVFFEGKNLLNYNSSANNAERVYVTGYIHKSRLISIESLPHIKLNKSNHLPTLNSSTVKNDSISLSIKTGAFKIKAHKITRSNGGCLNCAKLFVDKIDGKKPWGVDGDLPKIEITEMRLTINNSIVEIPVSSINDLYQPTIKNLNIYFGKKGTLYIYMPGNSDGAGGYDVVWIINNGKLLCRYIDSID
ncbi:MAG: hypothetical protein M3N14_05070 [Bacteroidota bacterium]|nr:hypothetical protein [Bacteroidota bacterium]